MEDIIQRVFAVIFVVLVFFAMPLYMTFEKKDDISYALATKITSNFVDEVTAKGYLSESMYNDFISKLAVTGNTYDIKLEHIARKYSPVVNIYQKNNNQFNLTQTLEYHGNEVSETKDEKKYIVGKKEYSKEECNVEVTYSMYEEFYTEKQILRYFSNNSETTKMKYKDSDNKIVYTMSVGDEFGVIVKNTNTTIATMFFNTFTFGAMSEENPRVYINYGGTIKNEEYRDFNIVQ